MCNSEIRQAAKAAKVYLWEIADAIGVSEPTFSRKLRYEMTAKEKKRIMMLYNKT